MNFSDAPTVICCEYVHMALGQALKAWDKLYEPDVIP
jgi:hypothetical protein